MLNFIIQKINNILKIFYKNSKLRCKSDKSKDTYSTVFINSGYGENIKRDRLIVMENVSDLTDSSQRFCKLFNRCTKM